MDNSWVLDVESEVFTRIKTMVNAKLSTSYPNIYYTTEDVSTDTNTKDFTVYIHELNPIEVGEDITGASINAIQCTVEVQVIVNTNKSDAKAIMSCVLNAFKELKFQGVSLPVISTSQTMHIAVARFRRIVNSNENY